MRTHLRRFSFLALTLLVAASCDENDPTEPVVGLPDALAPVTVSTPKNTAVEATITVTSIAGRDLTFSVVGGPSNGSVDLTETGAGLRVRYTPNTGFAGADQVTYRVADGVSTVDGVVNIQVLNAPPTAETVLYRRPAVGPFTFQVSGTDPDGDALTFAVADGPANGSLSAFTPASSPAGAAATPATTTAQATYTPDAGFLGDETFTYRANDGNDASPPATIYLTANKLPQAVVEGGLPRTVGRNAPTRVVIALSDADGDDVVATIVADPAHGTLGALETTASGIRILYTPTPGYAGDDAFTVELDDGMDQVTLEVTLSVVNAAPVAFNASAGGFVGSPFVIDLTGADPDDDPLTFEIVSGPAVGTLGAVTSTGPASAQVTYSPGAAGPGTQTFTFRVGDGLAFSAPATVTVQLQTEAPLVEDVGVQVDEDSSVDILLTGIDQQGDALTFSIVTPPSHGTLGPIQSLGPFTARVTYTPTINYNGADLFTFQASDGTNTSNVGQVNIAVIPDQDDPPQVVASPVETFTTHTNVALQVAAARTVDPGVFVTGDLLSNFIDTDNDGLTASLVPGSVTAGASVVVNADGTFVYTPPTGRTADDTFDYTVTDGQTPITRTVTVQFSGTVWFVDDTFGGAADGSPAAPFTTLAAAEAGSSPNDIVFVHTGNTGTTPLAGGFTFQAGQQLVGEPVGLTTALGTVVSPSAAARPVITNGAGAGVTLADGAVLAGIDVDAASGAGILATGVAGATLRSVDVTNAGGPGIDLDAPTGAWTLTTVSVSGSAGAALDVDGGSATLSGDPSLTATVGRSVEISSVTGGSIALSGPIADTGLGIRIDNNTGGTFTLSGASKVVNTGANPAVTLTNNTGATVAFTGGGLDIDVTTAAGFTATGGGTLTVEGAGNSVTATTGTPITIQNTTIGAAGATFESAAADGGFNGVVVDGTGTGPFSLTGVGSTGGSGGTLTNLSGDAVVLNATGPVTLANMIIGDPSAVAGQTPDATNFIGGVGVRATDVTGAPGLTVTNLLISRTASHGIQGVRVTGLAVSGTEILNAGDGIDEDAMRFGEGGPDGLYGTATVTNSVLDAYVGSGIQLFNGSGSVALTVSGSTIGNNRTGIAGPGIGQDGLRMAPSGTAVYVIRVDGGTTIASAQGEAIFAFPQATTTFDLSVDGVTIDGVNSLGGAIGIFPDGTASGRVQITNSTFLAVAGAGVWLEARGGSSLDGILVGNTVGTAAVPASGSLNGPGLIVSHQGTGSSRFNVESNVIHSHATFGIESLNDEVGGGGDIDSHVRIVNNQVTAPENPGVTGIKVEATSDHGLCADITGNTSAGSGAAAGIEVLQAAASVFEVVGLGAMAVDAYLASVNTSTAASLGGTYAAAAGSCTAPTPPSVP